MFVVCCLLFYFVCIVNSICCSNSKTATLGEIKQLGESRNELLSIPIKKYLSCVDSEISSHRNNTWMKKYEQLDQSLILFGVFIPDETTVTNLLANKLTLKWQNNNNHINNDNVNNRNQIQRGVCQIDSFHKSSMLNLWNIVKQRNWYQNEGLSRHLFNIANDIIAHDKNTWRMSTADQQIFLYEIMSSMKNEYNVSVSRHHLAQQQQQIVQNQTQYNGKYAKSEMVLFSCFNWNNMLDLLSKYVDQWKNFVQKLRYSNQKVWVLENCVLKYHKQFMQSLGVFVAQEPECELKQDVNNVVRQIPDDRKKLIKEWYVLIKDILSSAKIDDIIDILNDDFQLFSCCDENIDWIVKLVYGQIAAKQQRMIALTIVDYIIKNPQKARILVTQQCTDFVNKTLDLGWVLIRKDAKEQKTDEE